jgi:prevent-host-death family protein
MKQWPVQSAKNQLNLVIELARTEGPQTITRHGKPMAVVGGANEFNKFRGPNETPLEFFSRFKGVARGLSRKNDLPRKIQAAKGFCDGIGDGL